MDYKRIYAEFIADRRLKEPVLSGYVERHHVVPRAMGGGDEAENVIKLTAEDHFFAHLLLAKIHGGCMWSALLAMCIGRQHAGTRYLGRMRRRVAIAREKAAQRHSKIMKGRFTGAAHPMYGRPCSELAKQKTKERHDAGLNPMASPEAREKVSLALKGRVFTDEHRRKIAAAKTGQKRSLESRLKQSASMTGRTLRPETIEKLRAINTGRKKSPACIEKMRAANIGKRHSEATKAKIADSLRERGHPRGMLGKSHSPEYKAMMKKFNDDKRAYAMKFGVSARSVTKAMLASFGMFD